MDAGWEVYSKMVLKQLEDLGTTLNGLRTEIQGLKTEIAEMKGQRENVQDLKNWKDKVDEVCSPSQLKEMKQEVESLKLFKAKAITIFTVVQFLMGAILFAKDLF